MRNQIEHLRRRLPAESGFTLVELLLASTLMVVMLFAVLLFSETGQRSQLRTAERALSLRAQQVGLERITREIRQARTLLPLNAAKVEMDTYVRSGGNPAVLRRVMYDCSKFSRCRRFEGPVGGPVTAANVMVIDGVANADIFRTVGNAVDPTYVEIRLRVRVNGQTQPITLEDGVELRNRPG